MLMSPAITRSRARARPFPIDNGIASAVADCGRVDGEAEDESESIGASGSGHGVIEEDGIGGDNHDVGTAQLLSPGFPTTRRRMLDIMTDTFLVLNPRQLRCFMIETFRALGTNRDNGYECTICYDLLREPVGCGRECSARFCRVCLSTWVQNPLQHTCPQCVQPLTIGQIKADDDLRRRMDEEPTIAQLAKTQRDVQAGLDSLSRESAEELAKVRRKVARTFNADRKDTQAKLTKLQQRIDKMQDEHDALAYELKRHNETVDKAKKIMSFIVPLSILGFALLFV